MGELTKAQRKALEWVQKHEPVSLFPCDGVAPDMRFVTKRLTALGYVECVGAELGPDRRLRFAFSAFALTPAGRAALEPRDER